MSDREFDHYLTLLASLLRLSRKQRAAVADELRSHLEDRLEELEAQGIAHDEAVRQALAEFGDAAGLAGQFVAISQARRRRWLMRLTTFSICATVLVAAGLIAFWPGRNAGPGAAAIVAQDSQAESQPASADPFQSRKPSQEPTLEEKLGKRIDLEVVEMPLRDVLLFLRDKTGIQFIVRGKKLEEAGVNTDFPVTKSLQGVRVSTVLDVLLSDLELTYVDDDELVFITTPEDAESSLQVRVYDCRDILQMPAPPGASKYVPLPAAQKNRGGMFAVDDPLLAHPTSQGAAGGGFGGGGLSDDSSRPSRPVSEHDLRAERLMDIIMNNVDPASWSEVGGPGSISEYNGLVVVTQTARTHKKIERFLDMLREAAGLEVPGKVVR